MKKILSILLVLTLFFTLPSCSQEENASSEVNTSTTQGNSISSNESKIETNENKISSSDTSVPESTQTEVSKLETTPSNPQTSNVVTENEKGKETNTNVKQTFSPKVVASQCTHKYQNPTCTSFMPCTICGEHLKGLYQGQKIEYGHLYDSNKCVDCGLCKKACPTENTPSKNEVIDVFAYKAKDSIRKKSTSGGAAAALAEAVIDNGGVVFGASLNKDFCLNHIEIKTKKDN